MNNFDYHKPSTVEEAVHLLTDGAKALAGGMTLLPTIKQGLAAPDALVDLSTIEALVGIREHHDKGVVIGAMTTHATVSSSDLVREKIPSLASLASGIGDAQVRHRGTIGGSLANNDPAADYPAALLGLGGSVHTNKRTIAADDFFDGLFSTALEDDEVIAHVHLPIPQYAVYVKFPQPASRYALVGVFIAQINGGVRVAVTGAGSDGVFRAQSLETALNQNFSAAALSGVQENAAELMSDLHGSAAYRAHLITILAQRALN